MLQRSFDPARLDRRDLAACRRLLANGSKSFYAASFLLPRRVRDPATALYAFCRIADDAVDHGGGSAGVLAGLEARLAAAYRGEPIDHPADRALSATVIQRQIPIALLHALIEGFAWDSEQRRYETLADLEAYSARVAGTVGAMMAILMGARDEALLARACDLGIAMQLTNIARDVGEDARAGRLYLPMSWLREAGLDPERWLESPTYSRELAIVIERLLAWADQLYRRSESGIARLPSDCQPGIAAARFLYAEIGNELIRQGLDSVNKRAVVSPGRKLQLLARAARRPELSRVHLAFAPVRGAAHLVAAAAPHAALGASGDGSSAEPQWWNLAARVARVIDIFDRLERRDRGMDVAGQGELSVAAGAAAGS